MLEYLFNEVTGIQPETSFKKETPAQVSSGEFYEIFENNYLKNICGRLLCFGITKAEDFILHIYHATTRDSTITAQILANNFWSIIKGTSWEKSLVEFVQSLVDYRLTTIQATTTDIFQTIFWSLSFRTVCFYNILIKMSVLVAQCFVELLAPEKTPITLQNRNSARGNLMKL